MKEAGYMAAKTGKGYEQHGRRFCVKILRSDGKRGYVSFDTEEEAAAFTRRRKGTRLVEEVVEQAGVKGWFAPRGTPWWPRSRGNGRRRRSRSSRASSSAIPRSDRTRGART